MPKRRRVAHPPRREPCGAPRVLRERGPCQVRRRQREQAQQPVQRQSAPRRTVRGARVERESATEVRHAHRHVTQRRVGDGRERDRAQAQRWVRGHDARVVSPALVAAPPALAHTRHVEVIRPRRAHARHIHIVRAVVVEQASGARAVAALRRARAGDDQGRGAQRAIAPVARAVGARPAHRARAARPAGVARHPGRARGEARHVGGRRPERVGLPRRRGAVAVGEAEGRADRSAHARVGAALAGPGPGARLVQPRRTRHAPPPVALVARRAVAGGRVVRVVRVQRGYKFAAGSLGVATAHRIKWILLGRSAGEQMRL